MTYDVYIVKCSDGTFYTGCTNNIRRRLNEHNYTKRGAVYTSTRRPVVLKYIEQYQTLSEARRREYRIKKLTHWEKQKLLDKVINLPIFSASIHNNL